jgi:hypothetical protein
MIKVTLEFTFDKDSDYYKFIDDLGCTDENETSTIRLPPCKIRAVGSD